MDFLPCSDQAHLCLKNAMNFCTWYQLLLKMELWHCMNLEGWKFWLLKYLLFQMVIIISILESGLNSTDGLVGIMLMISTHILEPIHMQIALLHTEYVWKSEVWVCRNCSLLECFVTINHLQCFASSFVFFYWVEYVLDAWDYGFVILYFNFQKSNVMQMFCRFSSNGDSCETYAVNTK